MLTNETMNGEKFYDFIQGNLIPNMHPFPGAQSILIMDNCSIHDVREAKELLESAGIVVILLPPYSPDYNPVEELFSYVKHFLKDHDETLQVTNNLTDILKSAFESVTVAHCNGWIHPK